MRWRSLNVLLGFILSFAFAGLLYGQRAGRGIITGLVSGPAGAAVPDATVTVTGEVSAFKFVVNTSSDGNYGTPLLDLGTYTVQVEKTGFKTYIRKGIEITSGIEYRQDVILELGAVTQTVEVKAASEMINVQTADIGHTLNQRYYQDLPVVMGTDVRLAESMLAAQPGYTPVEPNGDPMFRGSAFNSRINVGQTMSVESYIDGAAFGYANGHNETQESSPPIEAIAEMRVDTAPSRPSTATPAAALSSTPPSRARINFTEACTSIWATRCSTLVISSPLPAYLSRTIPTVSWQAGRS